MHGGPICNSVIDLRVPGRDFVGLRVHTYRTSHFARLCPRLPTNPSVGVAKLGGLLVRRAKAQKLAFTTFDRTDSVQYGTSSNQDLVPVTVPIRFNSVQFDTVNIVPPYEIVPLSFVQGLYMPKTYYIC